MASEVLITVVKWIVIFVSFNQLYLSVEETVSTSDALVPLL